MVGRIIEHMSESNDEQTPAAREADRLCDALHEIAARERQICRLQAEQVLAVAAFVDGRRSFDFKTHGVWDAPSRRLVAMELADAKRCSVFTAERYLWDCIRLVDECPRLMDAFLAGDLSLQAARTVIAETATLRAESRPLADEILAEEIPEILPGQARVLARARVFEIDPDAADEAGRVARAERFVTVSPATGVGTGVLSAVLPAEQATACWHALDAHARALSAGGDVRSVSAIMADTLVERVTGQSRADAVAAHVNLVMTDQTLLGLDDQSGRLDKTGPVPASIARLLATSGNAWIRRLYTDPVDASVQYVDTGRRRFDGGLRELVLARDQQCRTSTCSARIIDVDHVVDWAAGGPTSASNGRGRCRRCHRAKHHPGVSIDTFGRPPEHPGDVVGHEAYERWWTPIGWCLDSAPPPALGVGSTTQAQQAVRKQPQELSGRPLGVVNELRMEFLPRSRLVGLRPGYADLEVDQSWPNTHRLPVG